MPTGWSRFSFLLLPAVLSPVLLSAQTVQSRVEEVGKSPVSVTFVSGGRIRMALCSSGIELIGRDDNSIRVSYDRDADVKVLLDTDGDRANVKITGCPGNNFRVTIEVPKATAIDIHMFAGELNVRDITGDKRVELHFGQLTMHIGKPEDYAHVEASVNSGDLEATAFDVSKGGLFRSFEKSGPGKYRLHAHVGAGELDLR
jgi:hypothetical protein